MRSMMLRREPESIFEELIQPSKYGPRMYESDIGTKENPTRISKQHLVVREYDAYLDADGGYHEELVKADGTGDVTENYGGTG